MNKTLQNRRQVIIFNIICFAVYFASYITRINYGASITAIVGDLGITKNLAGMVSTGSFITYGAGQLVSGVLGDKFRPKALILLGLTAVSALNIVMPFAPNIYVMLVIWCVNGFFQAMLWPPLVRIMAELLTDTDYRQAVITVSVASSAATIAIYLIVPLCITLSGWRLTFFVSAAVGIAAAAVWYFYTASLEKRGLYSGRAAADISSAIKNEPNNASAGDNTSDSASGAPAHSYKLSSLIALSGLIPVMCAIVLHGILRDGVLTWMPAFVSETYSLGTSVSILTAVVLPVFSIFAYNIASALQKKVTSELKCAAILFTAALVCALALLPLMNFSAVVSIILMATITGSMHGINLMLISRVPRYFARYGKVSTVSGMLNSFTYIGAALSTWGIALLSENFGWYFTISVWAGVAALGLAACLIARRRWDIFSKS
ncbi:MAG: MFS transporter [Eubacteriales bacterium]